MKTEVTDVPYVFTLNLQDQKLVSYPTIPAKTVSSARSLLCLRMWSTVPDMWQELNNRWIEPCLILNSYVKSLHFSYSCSPERRAVTLSPLST